jgi:dihydroorotate dehydrogenase
MTPSLTELGLKLIRLLPPETAHKVALKALALPLMETSTTEDPFQKRGLVTRNRVGIAAGFDKDGDALAGIQKIGAGFIEIGTILSEPWSGNRLYPRVQRLTSDSSIWNRLGFPSKGCAYTVKKLSGFKSKKAASFACLCNIGPHPEKLRKAESAAQIRAIVRNDLCLLVDLLIPYSDGFVVNLSSPNTKNLRNILFDANASSEIFFPLVEHVKMRAEDYRKRVPLIIKFPPETTDKQTWDKVELGYLIEKVVLSSQADGIVATNTSIRLAEQHSKYFNDSSPGGVSGKLLRDISIDMVRKTRSIAGNELLIIGCGGVTEPCDAVGLIDAGADLIEIYTGLIFKGPSLLRSSAELVKRNQQLEPNSTNNFRYT